MLEEGRPCRDLVLGSEDGEGPGRSPSAVLLSHGEGFLVYHIHFEALGIFVGFERHVGLLFVFDSMKLNRPLMGRSGLLLTKLSGLNLKVIISQLQRVPKF